MLYWLMMNLKRLLAVLIMVIHVKITILAHLKMAIIHLLMMVVALVHSYMRMIMVSLVTVFSLCFKEKEYKEKGRNTMMIW